MTTRKIHLIDFLSRRLNILLSRNCLCEFFRVNIWWYGSVNMASKEVRVLLLRVTGDTQLELT